MVSDAVARGTSGRLSAPLASESRYAAASAVLQVLTEGVIPLREAVQAQRQQEGEGNAVPRPALSTPATSALPLLHGISSGFVLSTLSERRRAPSASAFDDDSIDEFGASRA